MTSAAWRSSSCRTTWPSSPSCATASWCSTPGRWWSPARPRRSSSARGTLTPRRSWRWPRSATSAAASCGSIEGQPPPVGADITGCRFAERCPVAADVCRGGPIAPVTVGGQARGALRAGPGRPGRPANWRPGDRPAAASRTPRRCSRSTRSTWSWAAAGGPTRSCGESIWPSVPARSSAWSARPARARRPWPGPWPAWSSRRPARSCSRAPRSPPCAAAPGGPSAAAVICSWSSRTRSARSTPR